MVGECAGEECGGQSVRKINSVPERVILQKYQSIIRTFEILKVGLISTK